MNPFQVFNLLIALSLIWLAILARLFVWPRLMAWPVQKAFIVLLVVNSFRHLGMYSLFPSVVGEDLSKTTFALHQAYGDLLTMLLAVAAILAVHYRSRLAMPLIWVFSIVGVVGLLEGLYNGLPLKIFEHNLGIFWLFPPLLVPLFLVVHYLMFALLARRAREYRELMQVNPVSVV